jgi:hypothetical protein
VSPILYLYALVDEEPGDPLGEGIGGESLRRVQLFRTRDGGLSAVVGDLAERPRPDRGPLERQDAVVRRLAESFGAILPARFGEVFADEAALAARLIPREREVAAALALVRGCVQMTLRIFGEPEPAREPAAEPEEGGPGTRYLAARRRESERAHSLPEIDPLREALRPLLRAERMERHAAGPLLGTAYHLVARGQEGAYRAALEGARQRMGGRRVAATGPWPPYAFAPEGGR